MNSTHIHKLIFGALAFSFAANVVLWFNNLALDHKLEKVSQEIEYFEHNTSKILSTIPKLKQAAQKVLDLSNQKFAPNKEPASWCAQLLSQPYIESSFKVKVKVHRRELPFGMDTPWTLRQIDKYVHPSLVPYMVHMDLNGTLNQIIQYLTDIDRHNRSMVICRLDLAPEEQGDRLVGTATISFPQPFYDKDSNQIQRFVKR